MVVRTLPVFPVQSRVSHDSITASASDPTRKNALTMSYRSVSPWIRGRSSSDYSAHDEPRASQPACSSHHLPAPHVQTSKASHGSSGSDIRTLRGPRGTLISRVGGGSGNTNKRAVGRYAKVGIRSQFARRTTFQHVS